MDVPPAAPPGPCYPQRSQRMLVAIGLYKLLKAAVLVAVSIGALKLMHRDLAELANRWIAEMRVDPDNYYANRLLSELPLVNDHLLRAIGIGSLIYAAVQLIEGVGLCLRQRWAEYLTIVLTAGFIP